MGVGLLVMTLHIL